MVAIVTKRWTNIVHFYHYQRMIDVLCVHWTSSLFTVLPVLLPFDAYSYLSIVLWCRNFCDVIIMPPFYILTNIMFVVEWRNFFSLFMCNIYLFIVQFILNISNAKVFLIWN